MPPMWSGQATPDGLVTPSIIDYHRRRAAAGCGLIIVEHAFVHPRGRHSATQIGVHADATVDGLGRLAQAISARGRRRLPPTLARRLADVLARHGQPARSRRPPSGIPTNRKATSRRR